MTMCSLAAERRQIRDELTAGDFYPIGISARVEGIDDSENVQIRTLERVDISDIEVADNHITATASIRGEISDISDEEEAELFSKLRGALLKFVQGYQWGVWARSYILQRKNLHDLACSLTDYLNLNTEKNIRSWRQIPGRKGMASLRMPSMNL